MRSGEFLKNIGIEPVPSTNRGSIAKWFLPFVGSALLLSGCGQSDTVELSFDCVLRNERKTPVIYIEGQDFIPSQRVIGRMMLADSDDLSDPRTITAFGKITDKGQLIAQWPIGPYQGKQIRLDVFVDPTESQMRTQIVLGEDPQGTKKLVSDSFPVPASICSSRDMG